MGGWTLFDGSRAIIVGDYVTPFQGEHAGRLGPWASLLEAMGVDPRCDGAKSLHVGCGVAWLLAAIAAWRSRPSAGRWTAGAALLGLWYLPFGTLAGVIALLVLAIEKWGPRSVARRMQ